nr:transposase [Bifidobacterium scardovii]
MGPAAGGHTYITVVVNHERHRVIRTHNGYGRDVFNLFFQQLTEEQRASIRVVTGDGAGSTHTSTSGVRRQNTCWTGSTSSPG